MLIRGGVFQEMNLTKDRYFIDTNIIVYTFDRENEEKRKMSIYIVRKAIETGYGIVSYQVIQEFCNVALKKFKVPLTVNDCKTFISRFLYPICDIFPGIDLYNSSLAIHEETGYGFYDSLIIASAIQSGCSIIYSEDMTNEHEVKKGLRIINPFIQPPAFNS